MSRMRMGGHFEYASTAAVTSGKLWSWGEGLGSGQSAGQDGKLGTGSTTDVCSPNQIGAGTTWDKVCGVGYAAHHVLASDTAGKLWAWGWNDQGQLGNGTTTSISSPVQIGALTTWTGEIGGANNRSSFAIKGDGTLWSWGDGVYGTTAHGNTTDSCSPVQVGSLTNWSTITKQMALSGCSLKTDGTIWCWGAGFDGKLGQGNTTSYSSPVQVGSATDWVVCASSEKCALMVNSSGKLYTMGAGYLGTLGHGNNNAICNPTQVGSLTNWTAKIAGNEHGFKAIKSDGTLWHCGHGAAGQAGNGTSTTYSSPIQIGSLTNWGNVHGAGYYDCYALRDDQRLFAWGKNLNGSLGLGDIVARSSPSQIGDKRWMSGRDICCGNQTGLGIGNTD